VVVVEVVGVEVEVRLQLVLEKVQVLKPSL